MTEGELLELCRRHGAVLDRVGRAGTKQQYFHLVRWIPHAKGKGKGAAASRYLCSAKKLDELTEADVLGALDRLPASPSADRPAHEQLVERAQRFGKRAGVDRYGEVAPRLVDLVERRTWEAGHAQRGTAERLRRLLDEYCPNHRREVHVLAAAAELGAPQLAGEQLVTKLDQEYGIARAYGRWAAAVWAAAAAVQKG